jgi:putative DNA methylase
VCERKKRAQDALTYNALVQSWPEIQRLAGEQTDLPGQAQQSTMFS